MRGSNKLSKLHSKYRRSRFFSFFIEHMEKCSRKYQEGFQGYQIRATTDCYPATGCLKASNFCKFHLATTVSNQKPVINKVWKPRHILNLCINRFYARSVARRQLAVRPPERHTTLRFSGEFQQWVKTSQYLP